MSPRPNAPRPHHHLDRRSFLLAGGATALALGSGLLEAAPARAEESTVVHTLVFSFPDAMPDDQRTQFFTEMSDVVMGSGLAQTIDHRPHLRLPDDDYAPVFVASAITEIRCQDLATLETLSGYPALGDFRSRWQAKYPYQVVWTNHQPLSV